jgi:branched-chain amino acid transport system permease protein
MTNILKKRTAIGPPQVPDPARSRRHGRDSVVAVVVVASLVVPTLVFSTSLVSDSAVILGDVLFAVGVSFVIGVAGVPAFGNQLFFGAAAYVVAEIATRYGVTDDILFLLAGVAVAAILAFVFGWALKRLHGLTFGMATLAVGQLAYIFVYQTSFFAGATGISGVPLGNVLGAVQILSTRSLFVVVWVITVIAIIVVAAFSRSHYGTVLRAIRDSPVRARALGVRVSFYRVSAYVIGGAISGAAGVVAALNTGTVDPSLFYWTAGAIPVLAGLIGGIDTIIGPIVGAVIFGVVTVYVSTFTEAWLLIEGLLALGMYLVWPEGLFGTSAPGRLRSRLGGLHRTKLDRESMLEG